MRKILLAVLILLIAIPVVVAVARSYQQIYPSQYLYPTGSQEKNDSSRERFQGLQGIAGISVEESEPWYRGPPRKFGKPRLRKWVATAPLPASYVGLGGTAEKYLNIDPRQCVQFGCTAWHNVVGDSSTKKFYRCRCENAANIFEANIKCITTPTIALRIGYTRGECYPGEAEDT